MQLFTCAVNSNYVYRCLLNSYGKGTSACLRCPYKGLDGAFLICFNTNTDLILFCRFKIIRIIPAELSDGLAPNAYTWWGGHFLDLPTVFLYRTQRVQGDFSNIKHGNAAGEWRWGNPPAGPAPPGLSITASSHSCTHCSPACSTAQGIIAISGSVVISQA